MIALTVRLLPGERIIDDAYITFRYARNLLAGNGLVYNPGERVFGTTTPLYTLLLAGLAGLLRTDDFPTLSVAVNALADGLNCALLVLLGTRLSGQRLVGWCAALLWAVAPMSVTFAVGGMETSIFILLMLATFSTYLWGYFTRAALLGALSLLTRPDALLFVGPLALDYVIRIRPGKQMAKPVAVFVAPLAAWAIFATLYYGTPITSSVTAKTVAYQLPPTQALARLWQHYSTPFFEHTALEQLPSGIGLYWPLPGILLYLTLYSIGVLRFARRDPRALAIGLYPLIYLLAFAIANPLIFRWYLAPPLPVYFLAILGGLAQVASDVAGAIRRTRSDTALFLIPVVIYGVLFVNAWTLHPDHGPARPAPKMAWFALELLYERVGRELATQVQPDAVVAAGDIGALGYYSGARILDTLGLISPESVPYYPLPPDELEINYAISADLVHDLRPDYLVMLEVYGRHTLLVDPRFAARYRQVQVIDTDIYGSEGMLVFKRADP